MESTSQTACEFTKYLQDRFDPAIVKVIIIKQVPILEFNTPEDEILFKLKYAEVDITHEYARFMLFQEFPSWSSMHES